MKLNLTNMDQSKNGHPEMELLLCWLNGSKIDDDKEEHINNCNLCQKEIVELYKDNRASLDAAVFSIKQSFQIQISKLKAGLNLLNPAKNSMLTPLPLLRSSEENENILQFSQIQYLDGVFIKITVSKPGTNLQIKFKALGNLRQGKNFLLYINSTLQESLTLLGRQSGEFKNIENGHIRVLVDEKVILEMDLKQIKK